MSYDTERRNERAYTFTSRSSNSPRQTKHEAPALEFKGVSFSYARADAGLPLAAASAQPALHNISLSIEQGSFCLLCGSTGAGKSSILRLAKPGMAPAGTLTGDILIKGRPIQSFDVKEGAQTVAFVAQDPETQLVCDRVWHELAFGLENLGVAPDEMRRRVAQLSYFLGIEALLHKRCSELSSGQAQLVALASVLVLEPDIVLLDEPTSMLDPLARSDFAHALFRLNRELGMSIVLATHEPWTLAPYASEALLVKEGRIFPFQLSEIKKPPRLCVVDQKMGDGQESTESSHFMREAWIRYGREAPWVLRGLSLKLKAGQIHALLGANGSGKSTALKAFAGLIPLSKGLLSVNAVTGKEKQKRRRIQKAHRAFDLQDNIRDTLLHKQAEIAYLPQRPELLFSGLSLSDEIALSARQSLRDSAEVDDMIERLGLTAYAHRDPLDLSRGQRQLVALAKVFVSRPRLLLADELTVGLDLPSRELVARLLSELAEEGSSVVLASHDLELVRAIAHECSLLFDGDSACTMPTDEFFSRSLFFREEAL